MMKWNKNFADLLAPYYDRILKIVDHGPDPHHPSEIDFHEVIKKNLEPKRTLQTAWQALQSLPEAKRKTIVEGFRSGDRQEQLQKSRTALTQLEANGWVKQIDYHQEMVEQGIVPPDGKIIEPLGRREDFLRDRATYKYNGR